MESYKLKYTGEEIDALLQKANISINADEIPLIYVVYDRINMDLEDVANQLRPTIQQIYNDWKNGKNPVLIISNQYNDSENIGLYVIGKQNSTSIFELTQEGFSIATIIDGTDSSYLNLERNTIRATIIEGDVTNVSWGKHSSSQDKYFLSLDTNYSKSYIPQYDGSPATKKYVDDSIASIGTADFITVVDTLPTVGLSNRLYFVPKTEGQTQDLFDEYAWINNKWEWITTKQIEVDLSNYYTKTEVDSAIGSSGFTKGMILMWSGSITTVPTGWSLCDGTNGTPDLRNRFVVGAGSTYAVGATGGSNTVSLTTAQMPSHNHSVSATISGNGEHTHNLYYGYNSLIGDTDYHDSLCAVDSQLNADNDVTRKYYIETDAYDSSSAGTHSHTVSISESSIGSGSAHENRPPYYALAYIMKL